MAHNTRVIVGCKELRLFGFYRKRNFLSKRRILLSNRMCWEFLFLRFHRVVIEMV